MRPLSRALPFSSKHTASGQSLEVRAHDLNQFVGRERLLGAELLGVDDGAWDYAVDTRGRPVEYESFHGTFFRSLLRPESTNPPVKGCIAALAVPLFASSADQPYN